MSMETNLLRDAISTSEMVLGSMPKPIKQKTVGIRSRYVLGQIVVVLDSGGPTPLKVAGANSFSLRLVPLTKVEIEDFLVRARAAELVKQAAQEDSTQPLVVEEEKIAESSEAEFPPAEEGYPGTQRIA